MPDKDRNVRQDKEETPRENTEEINDQDLDNARGGLLRRDQKLEK